MELRDESEAALVYSRPFEYNGQQELDNAVHMTARIFSTIRNNNEYSLDEKRAWIVAAMNKLERLKPTAIKFNKLALVEICINQLITLESILELKNTFLH